jgi:hypothetical protein
MFSLKSKFLSLPAREQKQIIIIVLLGSIGSYGLLATHMWQSMFEAQKMADRRANRIETRIGNYKTPEIDSSLTPKQLDTANAQLTLIENSLINFSERLLPLDSPEPRESLKLEVTRLATQHGISITYMTVSNTETRLFPSEFNGKALRNLFDKRPLFQIKGTGEFYNFIDFTESLKSLPYRCFIPNLSIMRPEENSPTGSLVFQLDLQM